MARTITRWCAVAVMGVAVVTATADGFAQSYAGLYAWALEHGLHGWKAASFPLMVDLLIVVGELGLFLLAIDAYSLQRKHFLTWFDFLLPLLIAVAGWTASLIFNVGHVQEQDFSFQATAAVPPIVSMLGLLVLLRTLHRYVSDRPTGQHHGALTLRPAAPDAGSADSGGAAQVKEHRFISIRDGLGHGDPSADDLAPNGGGFRLVRLPEWSSRNGAQNGAADQRDTDSRNGQDADRNAQPQAAIGVHDAEAAAVPAEPAPEPAPVLAAEPTGNGRGGASTPTLRHAPKERLLEELHEQQGDLAAALESMTAEGLTYDAEEARRVRRNNWLPYVVYRLLAQHDGDVNRVSQALLEKRIDCEPPVLEELARSWR